MNHRRVQLRTLSLLLLSVLTVALGYGCAKQSSESGATTNTATSSSVGNLAQGRTVFTQNCAACHGATGREGGVGPSLRDEKLRKNYDATIVWIKHPQPPMPALYPSPLSEKAVDNVATYVQSL